MIYLLNIFIYLLTALGGVLSYCSLLRIAFDAIFGALLFLQCLFSLHMFIFILLWIFPPRNFFLWQFRVPNVGLIAYSLHLYNGSSPPDAKWRDLIKTVWEVTTNVLNVFSLAQEGLRRDKRDNPTADDVKRYWQSAQLWVKQDQPKTNKGVYLMTLFEKLLQEYRVFY